MLGMQRRNCPPWLRAGGAAHPRDIPGWHSVSPSVPGWKAPATVARPGCRATRTGRSMGRGSAPAVPPPRLRELIPARRAQRLAEHPFVLPLPAPRQDGHRDGDGVSPCLSFPSQPDLPQPRRAARRGPGASSTPTWAAPPRVAGLYKPGLEGAQEQALLPDSRPEMPREQPCLWYCSMSLLPSPANEKQQEEKLTSPLPALRRAAGAGDGWAGGGTGAFFRGCSAVRLGWALWGRQSWLGMSRQKALPCRRVPRQSLGWTRPASPGVGDTRARCLRAQGQSPALLASPLGWGTSGSSGDLGDHGCNRSVLEPSPATSVPGFGDAAPCWAGSEPPPAVPVPPAGLAWPR